MKIRYLTSIESVNFRGGNVLVALDYNDVLALGASADNSGTPLNILPGGSDTLPAGTMVKFIAGWLDGGTGFDFSDAGITSLTLKLGDDGDDDRFRTAIELAEDGTEIDYFTGPHATNDHVYPSANTVDAIFTSANGGSPLLSECTSGKVFLLFATANLTAAPRA